MYPQSSIKHHLSPTNLPGTITSDPPISGSSENHRLLKSVGPGKKGICEFVPGRLPNITSTNPNPKKTDDRNSETQATTQQRHVFQGLVPRTVPWVKIVGSWWFQVSEVDFYFSGGYEKPSNFIGDIWIFMEGWWDNTDFQVRVVVQIFVMCFPRKFWGRMKSNLIGIFFQMGWLKPATRKWFFDSSPYQFFMLCYFQWSHFWEENTCF